MVSSEFTPIQSVTSAILESLLVHVIFLISDDNIEDEVSVFLSKVNVPVIVIVLSNSFIIMLVHMLKHMRKRIIFHIN